MYVLCLYLIFQLIKSTHAYDIYAVKIHFIDHEKRFDSMVNEKSYLKLTNGLLKKTTHTYTTLTNGPHKYLQAFTLLSKFISGSKDVKTTAADSKKSLVYRIA